MKIAWNAVVAIVVSLTLDPLYSRAKMLFCAKVIILGEIKWYLKKFRIEWIIQNIIHLFIKNSKGNEIWILSQKFDCLFFSRENHFWMKNWKNA